MHIRTLRDVTRNLSVSFSRGEIVLVDGKWYVTHSGLLHVAQRRKCNGIRTALQHQQSDPAAKRWIFKATVFKHAKSRGFVGYGDADPSNVSSLVRGAEMRIAETRAVNRALRKAYGIGLCSVEELGWQYGGSPAPTPNNHSYWTGDGNSSNGNTNGANHGQRLRDQLCILIRKYNLDPNLVKQYAADYCGTAALKDASREIVASFISHLAESAQQNRDALICKLNSYSQPEEAHS